METEWRIIWEDKHGRCRIDDFGSLTEARQFADTLDNHGGRIVDLLQRDLNAVQPPRIR